MEKSNFKQTSIKEFFKKITINSESFNIKEENSKDLKKNTVDK